MTDKNLLGGKMMDAIQYGGKIYIYEPDARAMVDAALATNVERNARIAELEAKLAARPEERDTRPWNQQDADMLAAAVDKAIRLGALDGRSEIADCRLDYGRPFSPEEVDRHLSKRRHGKNQAHVSPQKPLNELTEADYQASRKEP